MPLSNADRCRAYRSRQADRVATHFQRKVLKLLSELRHDVDMLRHDVDIFRHDSRARILPLLDSETLPARKQERILSIAPQFDSFWSAWPLKEGKKDALKAFPKALHSAGGIESLIAAVERYKAHKPVDRNYMLPATFLRGERFKDAYGNGFDDAAEISQRRAREAVEREALRARLGDYINR